MTTVSLPDLSLPGLSGTDGSHTGGLPGPGVLDVVALDQAVQHLRAVLRDGLLAADIWDVATGLTLVSHNSLPAAAAMLNSATEQLADVLALTELPGLAAYQLFHLAEGRLYAVIEHPAGVRSGLLVDAERVTAGALVDLVIPHYRADIAATQTA